MAEAKDVFILDCQVRNLAKNDGETTEISPSFFAAMNIYEELWNSGTYHTGRGFIATDLGIFLFPEIK